MISEVFQNDWITETDIINERDFASFKFKLSLGRMFYIAQTPRLMSTGCRIDAPLCHHKDSPSTHLVLVTHWDRNKIAAVSQTTLSNAFSWMKMLEFRLRFHWSLFLRVQLTIFQYWFRWWLGAGQATSHYLNQWWLVYWRIYPSLGLNELRTPLIKFGQNNDWPLRVSTQRDRSLSFWSVVLMELRYIYMFIVIFAHWTYH